ncbi:hypothetical protein LP419_16685 [Massilia sp. H-1]|nr:hypothetical protein LP419_16685 [Massilia sp. H-1]
MRVEKQQHLAAPAQVSLRELAYQAREDCASGLAARELTLAIAADDITLLTDALLLRQALGNLLDNAIDFSPRAATIELTVTRREDTAVIGVRDQGPGIPDYAQERLFERFYSLPRPEGAKSTGLGLPFVREAVALHRGRVTVVNAPRGGVLATVELPLL